VGRGGLQAGDLFLQYATSSTSPKMSLDTEGPYLPPPVFTKWRRKVKWKKREKIKEKKMHD
jgi:hypothetical protein